MPLQRRSEARRPFLTDDVGLRYVRSVPVRLRKQLPSIVRRLASRARKIPLEYARNLSWCRRTFDVLRGCAIPRFETVMIASAPYRYASWIPGRFVRS